MEEAKVHEVMEKIENFYFSEGEDSGEALFLKFAEKYSSHFDENFTATSAENKLE